MNVRSFALTRAASIELHGASIPTLAASRRMAPLMKSISLSRRAIWSRRSDGLEAGIFVANVRTCSTASSTLIAIPLARATCHASSTAARLIGPMSGSFMASPMVIPVKAQGALYATLPISFSHCITAISRIASILKPADRHTTAIFSTIFIFMREYGPIRTRSIPWLWTCPGPINEAPNPAAMPIINLSSPRTVAIASALPSPF